MAFYFLRYFRHSPRPRCRCHIPRHPDHRKPPDQAKNRPEEGRKRTAPAEPGRLQKLASLVFLHALRQNHERQQEEEQNHIHRLHLLTNICRGSPSKGRSKTGDHTKLPRQDHGTQKARPCCQAVPPEQRRLGYASNIGRWRGDQCHRQAEPPKLRRKLCRGLK